MDQTDTATESWTLGDIVGIVAELQTYKNLLYLFLAFPLGLMYWITIFFGFVFGLVLVVFGIGIAILIGTVIATRYIAEFERWLANTLLTVDLLPYDDISDVTGTLPTLKATFDAGSTWRALGFVSMRLWVGTIGLIFIIFLARAIELLSVIFRYPVEVELVTINDDPVIWTITSLPEALLTILVGLVIFFAVLHLTNAFAYICERIATALLGTTDGGRGPQDDLPGSGRQDQATERASRTERACVTDEAGGTDRAGGTDEAGAM